MKMLTGSFSLHDVRDVEATCRSVIDRTLSFYGARLRPDLYEELLTEIVERCWHMSGLDGDLRPMYGGAGYVKAGYPPGVWDPGRSGLSFNSYANRWLPGRVVDWYRRKFGDLRYAVRLCPSCDERSPAKSWQPLKGDRLVCPQCAADHHEERVPVEIRRRLTAHVSLDGPAAAAGDDQVSIHDQLEDPSARFEEDALYRATVAR